jgi:hypothetical protein
VDAIRLGTRVDDEVGRVGFGALNALFRFLPCARRDLLRGLQRRLKETVNLLPGLLKRMPDRRRRRGTHLQFRYRAIDALDIRIDGPTLVAADRDREGDVDDVLGHVMAKVAEAMLLPRRAERHPLPIVLVISHGPSMTDPDPRSLSRSPATLPLAPPNTQPLRLALMAAPLPVQAAGLPRPSPCRLSRILRHRWSAPSPCAGVLPAIWLGK